MKIVDTLIKILKIVVKLAKKESLAMVEKSSKTKISELGSHQVVKFEEGFSEREFDNPIQIQWGYVQDK